MQQVTGVADVIKGSGSAVDTGSLMAKASAIELRRSRRERKKVKIEDGREKDRAVRRRRESSKGSRETIKLKERNIRRKVEKRDEGRKKFKSDKGRARNGRVRRSSGIHTTNSLTAFRFYS